MKRVVVIIILLINFLFCFAVEVDENSVMPKNSYTKRGLNEYLPLKVTYTFSNDKLIYEAGDETLVNIKFEFLNTKIEKIKGRALEVLIFDSNYPEIVKRNEVKIETFGNNKFVLNDLNRIYQTQHKISFLKRCNLVEMLGFQVTTSYDVALEYYKHRPLTSEEIEEYSKSDHVITFYIETQSSIKRGLERKELKKKHDLIIENRKKQEEFEKMQKERGNAKGLAQYAYFSDTDENKNKELDDTIIDSETGLKVIEYKTNNKKLLSSDEDNFEWCKVPAGSYYSINPDMSKKIDTISYSYSIMKYDVTNEQYLKYLNEIYAQGKITVFNNEIYGSFSGDSLHTVGSYLIYSFDSFPFYNTSRIVLKDSLFVLVPPEGYTSEDYLNHPVTNVSWVGATLFADYYGLRLPSKAEWEKSARGMNSDYFCFGNYVDQRYFNVLGEKHPWSVGSTPVGYYNGLNQGTIDCPSPYGLYDSFGNVSIWTKDIRQETFESCPHHYLKMYNIYHQFYRAVGPNYYSMTTDYYYGGFGEVPSWEERESYFTKNMLRSVNQFPETTTSPKIGIRCVKD